MAALYTPTRGHLFMRAFLAGHRIAPASRFSLCLPRHMARRNFMSNLFFINQGAPTAWEEGQIAAGPSHQLRQSAPAIRILRRRRGNASG
jgi:hypothetical protein